MNLVNEIKHKVEDKKQEKENKLINSAYKLFTKKGINNTSIQDIVDDAGVAKGTFYLYFQDKYKLQEKLVIKKSEKLFNDAILELTKKDIKTYDDQFIFIIDYVIDELVMNPDLIKVISKDLSLGFFPKGLSEIMKNDPVGIYERFLKSIKDNNIKLENPKVTLYMIIELVSSTCFSSIVKNEPLSINEFKPYLYKTIKNMLKEQ